VKFTNLTRRGLYFGCCHREVEPGGSFEVPWLAAKEDRAVRAAMADGAIGWESRGDEPEVPGSPHVPTKAELAEAKARREAEAKAKREADEKAVRKRMAEDEAGMKANMARMGNFKVPGPVPRRAPERAAAKERPITKADIISDGRPRSLADVMRHNRAVRQLGADGQSGQAVKTGQAGSKVNN